MYCMNYIVQRGDTLYSISRHFMVSINEIMAANPLINVYNLIVGETIGIPVSIPQNNYTQYTTYKIKKEDTLGNILDKNHINLADLMEFNKINEIYLLPGTTLLVPVIESNNKT